MTARSRFVQLALEQLGKPVLWARKGPEVFDCSGLVTWALFATTGRDLRETHNSQRLADESVDITTGIAPIPGDLLFFGTGPRGIEHVGIALAGGKALSADGATSHQLDLQVALANPHNRVRLHESFAFRPDLPYRSVHRFTTLDAADLICL